ncbi:MAG TPA: hypothetical protein VMJ10_11465 [Kofleriaceae bacterium]|nr:hypothetical protein [Kofleriaceae bacterium]
MTTRWISQLLVLAAACGQEKIEVSPAPQADYNRGRLVAAVDAFVAGGRTAPAFATLAQTVTSLRPGMDKSVAQEAELKMMVLGLAPVKALADKPPGDRAGALAVTVWPALLASAIEADEMLEVRDPNGPLLWPKPGEDATVYLERLCGGPLAADCKHVVPELQSQVVEAIAIRRATERVRNAVIECLECNGDKADPRWHEAVAGWEALDRAVSDGLADVERRGDPENWPAAGNAADDDPGLPEAEVSPHGDLLLGGHSYGPNQMRLDVLRELRGSGDAIELHVHPEITLVELRALLVDAHRAGCARIAVVAREPVYPWRRRVYWVAAGSGMRASLRPTDSLQLLLHSIDEVSGPGTVARVD